MKVCLKCLDEKPIWGFRIASCNLDGHSNYCNDCYAIYDNVELKLLGMKICRGCSKNLSRLDDFSRNGRGEPVPFCKKCKAHPKFNSTYYGKARESASKKSAELDDSYILSRIAADFNMGIDKVRCMDGISEIVGVKRAILQLVRGSRKKLITKN